MEIETTRFGTLEIADEDLLRFPDGLFGFGEVDRYVLLNHRGGSHFKWLQAVGRPDLAFVVIDPFLFYPDYHFDLPVEDCLALEYSGSGTLVVLAIVGIPDDPRQMTANLKGPIVVHCEKRLGRQVILSEEEYSPRYPILEAIQRRRSETPSAE
jgi:flagellar assembly factor FliW